MRILRGNYEGLQDIDELSPRLRKFLSEPKIQKALQESDFSTLYKKLQKTENYDTIGNFTQLLISSNIDPLSYLDYMPIAFLAHTSVKSIDIPNHVTNISDWAFCDCESLTSITIPDSVTSIGGYAFDYCTSLESIIIPNSVTSIGEGAFQDSKGLTSITIPDSVTSISSHAFYNCTSLTSVTIPDSVTSIGGYAFSHCTGLTHMTIGSRVTDIGEYAFSDDVLEEITYKGTKKDWRKINKVRFWRYRSSIKTIHCTDGNIEL